MKQYMKSLANACTSFCRKEDGSSTLEFLLVLPAAFVFAGATYETGFIGMRDMMLERAVDVTVRDVRVGIISEPTHQNLKENICNEALVIPDCMNQVKLEMLRKDVRDYVGLDDQPDCIDREATGEPMVNFTNGGNNELMILRACSLFDPMLPTAKIGASVPKQSDGAYALVATSSFVLEPFK